VATLADGSPAFAGQLVELVGEGGRQRDLDASARRSLRAVVCIYVGGSVWGHVGIDPEDRKTANDFWPCKGPFRSRASGLCGVVVRVELLRVLCGACELAVVERRLRGTVRRAVTGVERARRVVSRMSVWVVTGRAEKVVGRFGLLRVIDT
jgi:hypothetical protein